MTRAEIYERAIKKEEEQIKYYEKQIAMCKVDIEFFRAEIAKGQPKNGSL